MVKTNNKKVEKKESTKDTLKEEKIVKKSNGKFLLIIGIIVFMCIMTWIVKPGLYSNGEFIASESIIRNGIYDLFFTLRNTIYYNSDDIVYLLLVGASYGILSKTKGKPKVECIKLAYSLHLNISFIIFSIKSFKFLFNCFSD